MEILFWLAPAAGVTLVAMLWVSWQGRDPRAVDRETAARRIGEALARHEGTRAAYRAPRRAPDPATGVKVRRQVAASEDDREQQAS